MMAPTFTQINDYLTITLSFNNSVGSFGPISTTMVISDLFVANYATNGEANQLYFNETAFFRSNQFPVTTAINASSFGPTFGDVDNDGDLDLCLQCLFRFTRHQLSLPQ